MIIEHFTPDKLDNKKPIRLLFAGATTSGKTYYFRQLWEAVLHKHVDQIIIFCAKRSAYEYGTARFNYKGVPHAIYKTVDPDEIGTYVKRIMELRDQDYHDIIDGKKHWKKNLMIVFDDVAKKKLARNPNIEELYMSGRHAQISCVFITQKIATFTAPIIRDMSSHAIIFRCGSENSATKKIDEYIQQDKRFYNLSSYEKRIETHQLRGLLATDYQCLITDMEKGVTYRK